MFTPDKKYAQIDLSHIECHEGETCKDCGKGTYQDGLRIYRDHIVSLACSVCGHHQYRWTFENGKPVKPGKCKYHIIREPLEVISDVEDFCSASLKDLINGLQQVYEQFNCDGKALMDVQFEKDLDPFPCDDTTRTEARLIRERPETEQERQNRLEQNRKKKEKARQEREKRKQKEQEERRKQYEKLKKEFEG